MSTLTATYADLAERRDRNAIMRPTFGWISRVRAWFVRPAENRIEQMILANGGVMSDALERDISRHLIV